MNAQTLRDIIASDIRLDKEARECAEQIINIDKEV